MFTVKSKTAKLMAAMQLGETFTQSQAEKRFGIKNIRAEATRIRQAGFAVYGNRRVAGNNVQVTEYRIGRPTRELIAAGYRALHKGM